jgi:DNA repair ATPase RecN
VNLAGKLGMRVVVVGDPGTGKSILIIALHMCCQKKV